MRNALPVPTGPTLAAFSSHPLQCLLEDKTALDQLDHRSAWREACLSLSSTCQFVLPEGGGGGGWNREYISELVKTCVGSGVYAYSTLYNITDQY